MGGFYVEGRGNLSQGEFSEGENFPMGGVFRGGEFSEGGILILTPQKRKQEPHQAPVFFCRNSISLASTSDSES